MLSKKKVLKCTITISFFLSLFSYTITTNAAVTSNAERKVLQEHRDLMLYGSNTPSKAKYNLSKLTDRVKDGSVYEKWVRSSDYNNFHNAWKKLSTKQKNSSEMKKVKKEYQSAKYYLKATKEVYEFYTTVLNGAETFIINPKEAGQLNDHSQGIRKEAFDSYNTFTNISGESLKIANRNFYLREKYLATVYFLDAVVALDEARLMIDRAKTIEELKIAREPLNIVWEKLIDIGKTIREEKFDDVLESHYSVTNGKYNNLYDNLLLNSVRSITRVDNNSFEVEFLSPIDKSIFEISVKKENTPVKIRTITFSTDNKMAKIQCENDTTKGIYTFTTNFEARIQNTVFIYK